MSRVAPLAQPPAVDGPDGGHARANQRDSGSAERAALQRGAHLGRDGVRGAVDGHVHDVLGFILRLVIDPAEKNLAPGTDEGVFADAAQNEYNREDGKRADGGEGKKAKDHDDRYNDEEHAESQARSDAPR